jgi:NAD(P)-dependent dehydrogenase (short-subunit alcohol dehydrogenase family)
MSIAVVTGASRGLGRLISISLAECGIDLILVGQDKERLLSTACAAKSRGVRVAPVQLDLADDTAPDRLRSVAAEFGGATILINNAAVQGPIGNSWEIADTDFAASFRLNFFAPAALCRALVPGMIDKGEGWIVNVSGGGATSPRPNFSAYGAAKTALVRFGETLSIETAPHHIRVNSVAPGAFMSGMTEAVMQAGAAAGQNETALAGRLLQQDSGAAEKAAALVTYLVAGRGRDITGKLISAVWDNWPNLHEQNRLSDLYTLRRTVPPEAVPA